MVLFLGQSTFLTCFCISLRAEKSGTELLKIYKRVELMSSQVEVWAMEILKNQQKVKCSFLCTSTDKDNLLFVASICIIKAFGLIGIWMLQCLTNKGTYIPKGLPLLQGLKMHSIQRHLQHFSRMSFKWHRKCTK